MTPISVLAQDTVTVASEGTVLAGTATPPQATGPACGTNEPNRKQSGTLPREETYFFGRTESSCLKTLLMDLVAKYDHRVIAAAPSRRNPSRSAVLRLVGVLGVLAFVFSAVSPDDDDIQQEFIQGTKIRQCVIQNCKSTPSTRACLVNPIHCALVRQRLSSILCFAIERVSTSDAQIRPAIFSSRTGDRSPPTKSSWSS